MRLIGKRAPRRPFAQLALSGEHQHLFPAQIHAVPIRSELREARSAGNDVHCVTEIVRGVPRLRFRDYFSGCRSSLLVQGVLLRPGAQPLRDVDGEAVLRAQTEEFGHTSGQLGMNLSQLLSGEWVQVFG